MSEYAAVIGLLLGLALGLFVGFMAGAVQPVKAEQVACIPEAPAQPRHPALSLPLDYDAIVRQASPGQMPRTAFYHFPWKRK